MTGRRISHFEILEEIGHGGMGVVYAARDVRLGRTVALKFLPAGLDADEQARDRFVREARAASALNHPNICTIHEIGDADDGSIFIAMALCAGRTLKERIADGPLGPREAVHIARELASGLAAAHRAGIVHRDVKPANLMVEDDGSVRILDFGLAKVADTRITRTGATLGTVEYMSPEQARGEDVDARTDVWSAGCVLYEMLTGRGPFEAPHATAVVYRLMNEEPEPLKLPDDFAGLDDVVRRCLKKDPGERYETAAELEAELARFGSSEPAPKSGRPFRLWHAIVPGAVVLILLLYVIPPGVRDVTGNIAVLPFRAVQMDSLECVALSELVSQELGDAVEEGSQEYWVIPQSDIRARQIRSGTEAAQELGAMLTVEGFCMVRADQVELDMAVVDARGRRQIGSAMATAPLSDKRSLQTQAASELSGTLPAWVERRDKGRTRLPDTENPAAFERYVLGRSALLQRDSPEAMDRAIAEFRQAISWDPKYAEAHVALAEALLTRDDYVGSDESLVREARMHLDETIRLRPSMARAYVLLADALLQSGDRDQAMTAISRAAEIDSNDWRVLRGQARFFKTAGDREATGRLLRKAVSQAPDFWPVRLDLGEFLVENGELEEAMKEFLQIERLAPDSYFAANGMGAVYYFAGRSAEAAEFFRRAAEIRHSAGPLTNLATVLSDAGRYEDAAEAYREATTLEDGRTDHRVWGNLALAEESAGRPTRAATAFGTAIELAEKERLSRPADMTLLVDLATYYVHFGEKEEAVVLADSALRQASDGFSWHAIATVFELAGDRERALHWIDEAIRVGYPTESLENDRDLRDLRSDPRYVALVRGDQPELLPEFE